MSGLYEEGTLNSVPDSECLAYGVAPARAGTTLPPRPQPVHSDDRACSRRQGIDNRWPFAETKGSRRLYLIDAKDLDEAVQRPQRFHQPAWGASRCAPRELSAR